jgi:hypothetical protein
MYREYVSGSPAPSGAADVLVYRSDFATHVEVKTADDSFNLMAKEDNDPGWTPQQKRWAEWSRETYGVEYWLAVFFRSKHSPWPRINRDVFLVPYVAAEAAVLKIQFIQKRLPYCDKGRLNPTIRTEGLFATSLWRPFQLRYLGGKQWEIPADHLWWDCISRKELVDERRLANHISQYHRKD